MVKKTGMVEGKIVTGSRSSPSGVRHGVRTVSRGAAKTDVLPGFDLTLRQVNRHMVEYEVEKDGKARITKILSKRR
ncbi:TPA: hypothetical protein HA249_02195 [Candidatus Woesearchaeota archaeon]|nr:hypothetical protein [Candidatus Woesearchaeota archaeon]HII88370.1 hypothetical protein [Candidatus Woesearchaeota archaeon]